MFIVANIRKERSAVGKACGGSSKCWSKIWTEGKQEENAMAGAFVIFSVVLFGKKWSHTRRSTTGSVAAEF